MSARKLLPFRPSCRGNGQRFVNTGILVRIEGDIIIIERDQSDKQVVDALVQHGVPRERIICAYTGEPLPAFM